MRACRTGTKASKVYRVYSNAFVEGRASSDLPHALGRGFGRASPSERPAPAAAAFPPAHSAQPSTARAGGGLLAPPKEAAGAASSPGVPASSSARALLVRFQPSHRKPLNPDPPVWGEPPQL